MAGQDVDRFLATWAKLKGRSDQGAPVGRQDIDGLFALVGTDREEALVATLAIDLGVVQCDPVLRDRGVAVFQALDDEDLVQAVDRLDDPAVLGTAGRRRHLLRRCWTTVLGPEHPVTRFLDDPSDDHTRQLLDVDGQWTVGCGSTLAGEVRRHIAWRALDQWIQRRRSVFLTVLDDPRLRPSGTASPDWEIELVQSLVAASKGFTVKALEGIEKLTGDHGTPSWKRQQIDRTVTAYAFLAVPRIREWLPRERPAFPPHEAAGPLELLGSSLVAIDREPHRRPALLDDLSAQVERHPWAAFLILVQHAGTTEGLDAGRQLLRQTTQDSAWWSALPWPGRITAFTEACQALADRSTAFRLLMGAGDHVRIPGLRACLRDLVETASVDDIAGVSRGVLTRVIDDNADVLSTGTRDMASRGFVCRAVIDGSNVVLAGRNGGGSPGSLALYEQALSDLRAHGFREIHTYFDASTRHRLPESEWRTVKTWESDGTVEITRGQADPHVISRFLEEPELSWIVTADDYREPSREFPDLLPYWFQHRLHFHHGPGGRLVWDRPFDTAELPWGAPRHLPTQRSKALR